MPKGNRETKKPKQDKPKAAGHTSLAASQGRQPAPSLPKMKKRS
jgi:hypothetical protein